MKLAKKYSPVLHSLLSFAFQDTTLIHQIKLVVKHCLEIASHTFRNGTDVNNHVTSSGTEFSNTNPNEELMECGFFPIFG